ncbi:MAG TPA: ABC transporter substrate-binding protein, partial [Acidimicrobiales bacterium]|nr:ABC transporter substrate-binding protein [Acidimicrobiales bacterium]
QSMAMPDDMTVVFTLKTALTDFQFVLADYPTSIAAPSFLSQVDAGNKTATPVGAGPFKLTTFRPNEVIILSANPGYYDGAPYLDGLKFTYVAGGPATYQSFQTGQIQFAVINDLQTEKQVLNDKVSHQGRFSDINNALLINNRPKASSGGSVMSDVRLRLAVAAAFNEDTYNQRVYQGLGEANNELFPPGSKWNSPSMKGPAYDLNKAKQLVAQVKQDTGWDGSVTFVCSNSPDSANVPLAVKSMLDPVGFNVKINNSLNIGEFITDVIVHPAYDLACWGLSLPDYDPVADLYRTYHSGSQGNFGQFSSPDMDAALEQMAKATTDSSLRAALAHFNDVWNATIPWVNIAPGQFQTIWQSNVHGITPVGGLVSFAKVWLS